MSITNFVNSTLHSFLSDKVYYIPDYQREYAWQDEQIADFWQDLVDTLKNNRQHFFGQIVIHQNNADGKFYIIDGQQRTTTAVILLAVLRDCFKEYAEQHQMASFHLQNINVRYIGQSWGEIDERRLHLGINDRMYFRENIQDKSPMTAAKTPSQKRIRSAYDYFLEELQRAINGMCSDKEKIEELVKYYNAFLNNFRLMVITTDDINEAFIIFETLNARGKELETADLLKNYIFMKAGSKIDTVKKMWMQMVDTLANRDDATKFIRYYWNSAHDFVREKGLYRHVCSFIGAENCEAFVAKLASMAELYNALESPDDYKVFNDAQINEILASLATMNVKMFYPLVFAMVNKEYEEADIKRILRAVEVLAFRNFVVKKLNSNRYETKFSQIANDLSHDRGMVDDALKSIRDITEDDASFLRALIELEIRAVPIAKYVLREIEDFSCPEKKTTRNNRVINLEHIMPKNNNIWQVDATVHTKHLYRLANQTIMLEEYNKSASNKLFSAKKENYKKSAIKMTQELLQYSEWGLDQIQAREQRLIEVIRERWALVD